MSGMPQHFLPFLLLALQLGGCSSSRSSHASAGSGGTAIDAAATGAQGSPVVPKDAGTSTAPSDASTMRDAAPTKPDAPRDAAQSGDAQDAQDAGHTEQPPSKTCIGTTKLESYVADPKLCVYVFAQDVAGARQLAFAPNGDLFVSNNEKLTVLWDADHNGASDANERALFAQASGLNHGVVFDRNSKFVYASSGTTVYRWTYASGRRTAEGAAEVVVDGIPTGGHSARPLAFDAHGRLIVSVGSASNVDTSQSEWGTRSQIRRYTIPASIPSGGLAYISGEVIASGMRNESGIFVDADDRLWGVENGRDNLADSDLGGDIHNDNPGEEINLVDGQGPKFYGYPHCFSEFKVMSGQGQGAQWADQTLEAAIQKTDAFCRDGAQVHPPAFVMPAHWAPLGVIRYTGRALPMTGDIVIGAHGSWNRNPASGRVVARAHLSGTTIMSLEILIGEKGDGGELRQGTWSVRPVDVRQGPDEAIYVSDDSGGRVLKIGYER